jgi:hypothetical protein
MNPCGVNKEIGMSRQETFDGRCGRRWWRAGLSMVFALAGMLGAAAAHADVPVGRSWAGTAPTIDGAMGAGEWDDAQVTPLARGRMLTMNDGRHFYVLLDVTSDTFDDPVLSSDWEAFVLAFDVDLNRAVTPRVDLAYASCPAGGRAFVKTYYLGGYFSGCEDPSPASAGAFGFGGTPAHRIWEFALDFAEIGVDPSRWAGGAGVPHVRLNAGLASVTPSFVQAEPDPSLYPAFGNAFSVDLAIAPTVPPGLAGITFAGVGLVPKSFIGTTGYANLDVPGYSYWAMDAPFGGTLNVFGNWADLYARGARSYRVLAATGAAAPTPLVHTWTNMRLVGTTWTPRGVGPDAAGRYPIPSPAETWYLSNLLVAWPTATVGDGTYVLSLELFDGSGSPLAAPPDNSLTLRVVNAPPVARIDRVEYAGTEVGECPIVYAGATPADFTFRITAHDANGALEGWSLVAEYGNNRPPIPIAADGYPAHRTGTNEWFGIRDTLLGETWRPPVQCAYAITLSATSRSQNGYGRFLAARYVKTLTYLEGTPPRPCPIPK